MLIALIPGAVNLNHLVLLSDLLNLHLDIQVLKLAAYFLLLLLSLLLVLQFLLTLFVLGHRVFDLLLGLLEKVDFLLQIRRQWVPSSWPRELGQKPTEDFIQIVTKCHWKK